MRGVHYDEPIVLQQTSVQVPLAPFDSPVHDALIRASMQVCTYDFSASV